MHNMLWLFVDDRNPGDQVGGHQVHAAEMSSSPTLVDLDPRAEDHCYHLQRVHNQHKESLNLEWYCGALVLVKVLKETDGEVTDGTHAEDKGTDPDKSRCVTGVIEDRSTWAGETKQEVEEEDDWAETKIDLDVLHHSFRVVVVGVKHSFGNKEAGSQGDDEDGEKKEAVEDGEGAHLRKGRSNKEFIPCSL